MKTFTKKAVAIGLSAISLISLASANDGKTIYLNTNRETTKEEIHNLYNRGTSEDSTSYITSSEALVDSLVGGVLIAENRASHQYDNGLEADSIDESASIIGGEHTVLAGNDKNDRISGQTRYETSVRVAEELGTDRNLIICSGINFVDALPATTLAAFEDRNILLVEADNIPEETKTYLRNHASGKDILVIGGENSVSENVIEEVRGLAKDSTIERINGADRYETSQIIARRFGDTSALVLTGHELTDEAFLAAIYAAKESKPLLIMNSETGQGFEKIDDFSAKYIYLLSSHDSAIYEKFSDTYTFKNLRDELVERTEIFPEEEVHLSSAEEEKSEPENIYSQTGAEAEAKEWIAARESNGSYTAYNPRGGYYGRYQLNPSLIHYGASPAEQEAAADAYVYGRYGSWVNAKAFWVNNGWY